MTRTHNTTRFIFAVVAIALMVLTVHALTSHQTETWSALRVLERFQKQGSNDCVKFELAVCTRQGDKDGMTVRAYCQFESGRGIMGIWGLAAEGIYITGYSLDYDRWQTLCIRDGCKEADLSLFARVLQ